MRHLVIDVLKAGTFLLNIDSRADVCNVQSPIFVDQYVYTGQFKRVVSMFDIVLRKVLQFHYLFLYFCKQSIVYKLFIHHIRLTFSHFLRVFNLLFNFDYFTLLGVTFGNDFTVHNDLLVD